MKKLIALILLLVSINPSIAQVAHPFRFQVYTGGPSLLKMAFKISSNYQDKVTYSGNPSIGFVADYKLKSWFSVGLDVNYRYGQMDFDVSDSMFFQEWDDRLDIVLGVFDPFGHYTLKIPRYRVMANMNFHFLKAYSRSDLYLSLGLGVNKVKPKLYIDGQNLQFLNRYIGRISFPLAYRISMGYAFHFTENFGVFSEVGLGGPIISGGLTARF